MRSGLKAQLEDAEAAHHQGWTTLYRTGTIAAVLAAVLFRRNIGAEVSLFTGVEAIPTAVADWYVLLQGDPLVSLAFLSVFDIVNHALVAQRFRFCVWLCL